MKRVQRRRINCFKKIVLLIVIILLILAVIGFTRRDDFVIYTPFSRKLFIIDSSVIDKIIMWDGSLPNTVEFITKEEKLIFSEAVNNLRYYFIMPANPIPMGGWSYRFRLIDGARIKSYYFGKNSIEINGFIYFCDMDKIFQLMEGSVK